MGFAASLVIVATAFLPAQQPRGRLASHWQGLMHKKIAQATPNWEAKRIGDVSFGYVVIRDKNTWEAMRKVAAARLHKNEKPMNRLEQLSNTLDWEKEVI